MRASGILLPISSVPSPYGIGGFSREAYEFVDQLRKAGQSYWQILPLGPTGYGDSPYQAFSTFAGNHYFISLEELREEGLLTNEECEASNCGWEPRYVDYGALYEKRNAVLRLAFKRFRPTKKYQEFLEEQKSWLDDYCLFMAIKNQLGGICWIDWPAELKNRDKAALAKKAKELSEELDYYRFLQYKFAVQWKKLKAYANRKGVRIIGDLPIYVAIDNADAWSNPSLFQFDKEGNPKAVAGCPPDDFCATGQLWGNPLYNWEEHKKTGYAWWIERISRSYDLYDVIRMDHFRGFDEYYSIPYGDPTAENGKWMPGPGMDLFNAIEKKLGKVDMIAEDLGLMTPTVEKLVKDSDFPNMKVLEFAFGGEAENPHLPHNYDQNCVVYTGTHDNNTLLGWIEEISPFERDYAKRYLGSTQNNLFELRWDFIRAAHASVAKLCIIPMQDYLGLGSDARINYPSSLGTNWKWRMIRGEFNDGLAEHILMITKMFNRYQDIKVEIPEIELEEEVDFFLNEEDVKEVEGALKAEKLQLFSEAAFGEQAAKKIAPIEVEDEPEEKLENELNALLREKYGRSLKDSTRVEVFHCLMQMTSQRLALRNRIQGGKKLYYISAEFLIGKLLSNNLINLGLYDKFDNVLKKNHLKLDELEDMEQEPSLGNGGLGRLAACFLDSIATLGLYGDGVGLNYHCGLFRQMFENNKQKELPNPWITDACWLKRQNRSFTVPFRDFTLQSTMYDIDVPGYENGCNRLHLFDLDSVDESIIGQDGIAFDKKDIRKNLTLFLYPDDSDDDGRMLRIYQQYFMVSNAAQLILAELDERGGDLRRLYDYVVIQINDTHPSLIIPELIRLMQERDIGFDEACDIVSKTCAYTNHTILAEALEKWPLWYLESVVPHLVPIIWGLHDRALRTSNTPDTVIIDADQRVHMARMDMHYGFSVNGVAALHTDILKKSELKPFYDLYPKKFNNKTNGITFRRWLMHCNPELTALLDELIGEDYKRNADELENLLDFKKDDTVLDRLERIKHKKKRQLCRYLYATENMKVNEDSIFDIQIKRLHEYKRQQLNALYAIYKYLEIKAGKKPKTPITMIFGAKAAPAYTTAKDIIHLILCLSEMIKKDKDVSPYFQVIMVENYNVTKAAKLIPAADVSEQISLASKEASGTGNMKFMLNGAVTLGTEDGANVEIHELVGDENIYIFGKQTDEVLKLYAENGYKASEYYENNPKIRKLVDFMISDQLLSVGDPASLGRLHREITGSDYFMALPDLLNYIETKEKMFKDYEDRKSWNRKMLCNIAKAGYFSSDRTIAEYNRDIWHLS